MAKDTFTTFVILSAPVPGFHAIPGFNEYHSVMINPEDISYIAERGIHSTSVYMKNGAEIIVTESVSQINTKISNALKDLIAQILPPYETIDLYFED
jgi:uncharacterized protein YlzI (FlbEa/FlbD family)